MAEPGSQRKRMLILDDESMQLKMLRQLFSDRYDVECAKTVSEAREKGPLHAYDVAIVDYHIEGSSEDGLALVADLRKHLDAERIFLLTADTMMGMEILNDGDYLHVAKPYIPEELERFVEVALRRRKKESLP